ncbi:MAG: hypothetical protein R6X12_00130 [bacterium]
MKGLAVLLAWLGVALFSVWLMFRLLAARGRVQLLPRTFGLADWVLVALALGYGAFHLVRLARRGSGPGPATDELLVPLVRFWQNWRVARVPQDSVRVDDLDWTIRVTRPDGPVAASCPPGFVIDPAPRCPVCGLPAGERRQDGFWLRSCSSSACNWNRLRRESIARTLARLDRAARKAWAISQTPEA